MAPPEDESLNRRLSAVLLADMTGYSRLMGESEAEAIAGLGLVRDVFREVVPQRNGTLEVFVGDCFVALFHSAVEAVEAAVDIQTRLAALSQGRQKALRIRIGIHLGEVVRTEAGLFGDSINIASRIQAEAQPGGITVSADVYRAVKSRLKLPFRDVGRRQLKNIHDPVHLYEVRAAEWRPDEAAAAERAPASPRRRLPRWALPTAAAAALVAVGLGWLALHRPPAATPTGGDARAPAIPKPTGPVVLGVMEIHPRGDVPGWVCDFTRDGLNTVLSKFGDLRVYSKQKIDFLREKRGLSEIEAAEQLGISKMISGTISESNAKMTLEVQVVDIKTGLLEASDDVPGSEKQLVEMQNQAALHVARALGVSTPAEAKQVLAMRSNDQLDDYKLLTETMGGFTDDAAAPSPPKPKGPGAWNLLGPAPAFAEPAGDEAAVRELLERYRTALEGKDMNKLAAVYVSLPDPMRGALERYFQNAQDLKVQFSNFDILVEGNEALATFTRSDDFKDAQTGKPVHLEMRVSSIVAKQDDGWRIRGMKKPS
ncbi:MAG TPA: adenylate/guanylate cyclase domain-containing protein [Candidatus Binatia bacterium]|nr:adenylate/guanylate cyclase domain-containing protein [Candidatus Binatia bacterium]